MTVAPPRHVDDDGAPVPPDDGDHSDGDHSGGARSWFSPYVVLSVVIGLVFIAIVTPGLAVRSPLGHDEAVYMLRGRDLLTGWSHYSGGYWSDFRAPGLPIMISGVGQVIGVHVTSSRLLVVMLAMVIMAATAVIGTRLASRSVGLLAAALLPLTYGFSLTATTVLADTPGAAFALIAVAIYLRDVELGRLRLSFAAVPLLAFASTLSRFGAPFMLGAGLLGVAVIAAPEVLRRRNWTLVVQSAVLAVAVGAVVALVVMTDTFTLYGRSPLAANSTLVERNDFTLRTGMADLIEVINPWEDRPGLLWSKAVLVIVVIGLLAAVVSVYFCRSRWRVVTFGLLAGIVSLGCVVASVGQIVPNYLMLTLPYWILVAAAGWEWVGRLVLTRLRDHTVIRRIVVLVVAVGLVGLAADAGSEVREAHLRYERSSGRIREASIVTGDRLGESCVLIARYTPQAGFYSGCRTDRFWGFDQPDASASLGRSVDTVIERWGLGVPPEAPIAVMLVEQATRQPDLTELTDQPDLFGERIYESGTPGRPRDHIIVETVDPCVSDRSCASFEPSD